MGHARDMRDTRATIVSDFFAGAMDELLPCRAPSHARGPPMKPHRRWRRGQDRCADRLSSDSLPFPLYEAAQSWAKSDPMLAHLVEDAYGTACHHLAAENGTTLKSHSPRTWMYMGDTTPEKSKFSCVVPCRTWIRN